MPKSAAKFSVRCPVSTCGFKSLRKTAETARKVAYAHKYQYGENHECVVKDFTRAPKRNPSRSDRLSSELRSIEVVKDTAQRLYDSIEDMERDGEFAVNNQEYDLSISSSGVEELRGELESWAENMSDNNMEHLPKYDEVTEAMDALQEVIDAIDAVDVPSFSDTIRPQTKEEALGDIETFVNSLEEIIGMDGSVSFPGMY